MSGSTNRYQVPPTVTVLTMMKARLVGATKGHALLKKKADALTVRYRQILKEIVEAKQVGLGWVGCLVPTGGAEEGCGQLQRPSPANSTPKLDLGPSPHAVHGSSTESNPIAPPPPSQGMGDAMKGSFFALAEAKYAGGDSIKHTVFDNVERATLKVRGLGGWGGGVKSVWVRQSMCWWRVQLAGTVFILL
jgi:hypothetical protein